MHLLKNIPDPHVYKTKPTSEPQYPEWPVGFSYEECQRLCVEASSNKHKNKYVVAYLEPYFLRIINASISTGPLNSWAESWSTYTASVYLRRFKRPIGPDINAMGGFWNHRNLRTKAWKLFKTRVNKFARTYRFIHWFHVILLRKVALYTTRAVQLEHARHLR